MLSNLLIVLGLVLVLAGAWLKWKTPRSQHEAVRSETAAQPVADTPEDKGYAFEKWVVDRLSKEYHKTRDWRSDKRSGNGTYAQSSMNPDVEVVLDLHGAFYPFAMECKWRQTMGGVLDLKAEQLARYRDFSKAKRMPVFLVLGVGGAPSAPASLYIVPLSALGDGRLGMQDLAAYKQGMARKVFYYDPKAVTLSY